MAHFDIFDICEAWHCLESDYNLGGWLRERASNQRRREACSVQLARIEFRARPSLCADTLTEYGKEIYAHAARALRLNPIGQVLKLGNPCLQDSRFVYLCDSQDVEALCEHLGRDANELGGLCDDGIVARMNALFPNRTDSDTINTQEAMDACESIQSAVHDWMQSREMLRDACAVALMWGEHLECFFDDSRIGEACRMVQDLAHRCEVWPNGSDELQRVYALLPDTVRELPETFDSLEAATDAATDAADEFNAVIVVPVVDDDRRPHFKVHIYEGPNYRGAAQTHDEGYGLWIDGVEFLQ